MDGAGVEHGIALLRDAVDVLLSADLTLDPATASAPGLVTVLTALETERRRLAAVDARVLTQAAEQHAAAELGRTSLPDLLSHSLRLSPAQARARVRRSVDLGPRRAVTGEALPPTHPLLAAAQAEGAVSDEHVDRIIRGIGRIPSDIAAEATPAAEAFWVTAARHEPPAQLQVSIDALLFRLDQDGTKPDDDRNYRAREAHLVRQEDGSWSLRGRLTDEAGLIWRTILDVLAKPDPAKAGDGDAAGDGNHTETECGCATSMRDDRSVGQRNHDALRDLGLRILRSGTLPESGGAPVTIVVRADLADVVGADSPDGPRPPDGLWQSEHGDLVRAETLMAMAGDAEVVPVLFDRTRSDCQLFLGRTHRIANRAQRRALTARDGGCSFPHCTAPASWCEVHHVIAWAIGGLTDIDNLCLVCPFHHREFEHRGWAVVMARGRPHWRPPTWVDPDQRLVINTVHHLPEIVFTVEGDVGARIRL